LFHLFDIYSKHGILVLSKRLLHTVHFNLSLRKSSLLLFNSRYTLNLFRENYSSFYRRLSSNLLVFHPSPSFSASSIEDSLETLIFKPDSPVLNLHIVSGFSQNKQYQLLELCLHKFKPFAASLDLDLSINIFGYDSQFLTNLSSNSFKINCYSGLVDEQLLIQSSLIADLFLSTSEVEGFGIPLLDSLLFGLQCVCTPIDSFLEINTCYALRPSQALFPSTFDISSSDEIVNLLLQSLLSPVSLSPRQRADLYINSAAEIETSSKNLFSSFLQSQLSSSAS
jgi:hypothetical protein